MSKVTITIPSLGQTLSGWSGLQVTRGIDSAADGFAFSVPWLNTEANRERFQAYRSRRVRISIDDEQVIEGYMEQLGFSFSKSERTLEIQGRGRAAPIVDMSAGPPFSFQNTTFNSIAQAIATGVEGEFGAPSPAQFGVRAAPDFNVTQASIEPGQTVYEFLSKLASAHGLFALPQPDGTLLFAKLSSTRAPVVTVIEGEAPLKSLTTNHDLTQRFYKYTAIQSRDGASASASVIDSGVDNRIRGGKVVKPEQEADDLEEAARFARARALVDSYSATATMSAWRHENGLWNPGDIIQVQASSAAVFNLSRLIIKRATMQLDTRGGEITQLDLALPELYDGSDVRGRPWAV